MKIDNLPMTTLIMMACGLFIAGTAWQNLQTEPILAPIAIFAGGVMFGLSTSFFDL